MRWPWPPLPTASATDTVPWKPPRVGTYGADWVQLKSGEWLRGELKDVQNKEVEFDSDEMDQQALKLKDVRQLYPAHQVLTQFEKQEPVYGMVVISNDVVTVEGRNHCLCIATYSWASLPAAGEQASTIGPATSALR